MIKAHVYDANLEYAGVRGANLELAGFERAYLWETDLRETNLARAYFVGTKIAGAKLRGARGLETALVEWIDLGPKKPRLEGEDARAWLLERANES